MPPGVAAQVAAFRDRDRGKKAAAAAVPGAAAEAGKAKTGAAGAIASGSAANAAAKDRNRWAALVADHFPSPRAAAALVLCMVGLGAVIGSVTGQVAQSAGLQTIIVDMAVPKKAPPPAEEPAEVAEAPAEEPAEVAEAPAIPIEEALPEIPEEPIEEALPEEPTEEPAPLELPEEFNPEETEELPEVKHVFMIVLGENGFEESFGPTSQAPYLAKTLTEQGELLTNYYAVGPSRLANQAALLSGQGPTQQLAVECAPSELAPLATDIVPGAISAEGQVEGEGCYYPAEAKTLPGQFAEANMTYRAYVQEAVPGTPEPPSCARPFGLFHQLANTPECAESTLPLTKLAGDLKRNPEKVPAFSYIVPNACHAGAVEPCEPGQLAGPAAAESFLREVVPTIVKSKAYEDDGLIAITSSEAPKVGPAPDSSACCAVPAYPNLPPQPEPESDGAVKSSGGGGHVGLLLLSKYVKPGTVNETTYANHFSLLLTLEELFGFEKLGYAGEPALLPFDSTVFNYAEVEEEESTSTAEEEGPAAKPRAAARSRAPVRRGPSGRSGIGW